ncbi:hypothetical protein [Vibrio cholerae]|uniref:hypothetical protein n=12 Tax=Vibrio cholerae TaxID=666 RepID=UPI001C2FF733
MAFVFEFSVMRCQPLRRALCEMRVTSAMRNDEVFVANSVKMYHEKNGISPVTFGEPAQDPPDILMKISGIESGIEVMKVDENSLNSRTSYFRAYNSFIRSVIAEHAEVIPKGTSYFVMIYHSSKPIRKIRKKFNKFFKEELVDDAFSKNKYEFRSDSLLVKFSKIASSSSESSFPMAFSNVPITGSSRNIDDLNARVAMCRPDLQLFKLICNSVEVKSHKCRNLKHQVDLALLDCYADKFHSSDEDIFAMYAEAVSNLENRGVFKRIYVVTGSGQVQEF